MKELVKIKIVQDKDTGIDPAEVKKLDKSADDLVQLLKKAGYIKDASRDDYLKNRKGKHGVLVRIVRQVSFKRDNSLKKRKKDSKGS